MAGHDLIVIGASAGGIPALRDLVPRLPADLAAAGIIVLHRPFVAGSPDLVASALGAHSKLTISAARDGERIEKGHFYIAPAGSHLLLVRGVLRTEASPIESFNRPSVDALFRSAAMSYGRRVIGVILTGAGHDGTAGLWQIKNRGGVTIVQAPGEAEHPSMPQNAIENVPVDFALPLVEIARKLVELVSCPIPSSGSTKGRVLIVEDELVVATDLDGDLRALGYDVVASVASAEEAVAAVSTAAPDIVLMDIKLAGKMRGTEAATLIWEQLQVPVIFMTAYADDKTLEEAKAAMPFGYLVKPYRPQQINAAIEIAMDRYRREMASY